MKELFTEAGVCHTFFEIPKLPFNQERKKSYKRGFSASSLNSFTTINIKIGKQSQKFNGLLCKNSLKRTLSFFQPINCINKGLIYQVISHICQNLFLL